MACQFTNDEVIELQSLVAARIDSAEAMAAGASHSNQALMQDEIDLLMVIQDILETAVGGACVFDLVQINELLGLVTVRMSAAAANRNNARGHSNMALMDEEIDLLESIQGKLEAAAATAAAPAMAAASAMAAANNNAAAVNAVVAVNAAANANANAAVANVAAVNAVVQAAAAENAAGNAAGNAAVSYSNNFHPLGGRRRRHPRKTRKGRKTSKKTRKGRKGTRRGRKGSRRA
jgi:hypothetical protein